MTIYNHIVNENQSIAILAERIIITASFFIKSNKSLKCSLNKIGPAVDPCSTPDKMLLKYQCYCLFVHIISYLRDMNKCNIENSCRNHTLLVLN